MHRRDLPWAAAALLLGAPVHTAIAQGMLPVPHRPTIGVMAGVNVAKLSGEELSNSIDSRTGLVGGVFVTFHITNSFAIEPEVLFSQKGATSNSDPSTDFTLKFDYIDVPVLLRFDVPIPASPIHPFFVAGPAFGLQVKCAAEGSSEGVSVSADCDDFGDQVGVEFKKKTFDMSGVVGAGLDFNLGGTILMVGARYEYGFSKVLENSEAKNRTWQVVAGLGF